jgi:hypothetical protein
MNSQEQNTQKKNEHGNIEFTHENGLTYERVTIELPKNVVNYYRALAYLQDKTEPMEQVLIAEDVIEHVESQLNGITPEDAKELFNLTPVFKALNK